MYPGVWDPVVGEVEAAGHEFTTDLHDAEFLIYAGGQLPDPLPANIGFVQFVFSGIDRLIDAGVMRPGGVRWANAAGVYGKPVAEIALTLLLSQLHHVKAASLAGSFRARGPIDAAQGWLFDAATVAIVGAGGIADALIPMLRPFGVKVVAVNRSGHPVEGADETHPMSAADHVWREADAFVLAMPLTGETAGLVDASKFAQMKDSAVVVNVGRGELIVTDENFGAATPLMDRTQQRLQEWVQPMIERGLIPVITGFYGINEDGKVLTFGRGGSDYSAAVVANGLDANRPGNGRVS